MILKQTITCLNVLIHVAPRKTLPRPQLLRAAADSCDSFFEWRVPRFGSAAMRSAITICEKCVRQRLSGIGERLTPAACKKEEEYMRRYYFDLQLGNIAYNDEEGAVLKTPEDAVRLMGRTLLEVGEQTLADAEDREARGTVRDDTGIIWRGRLSLQVQRLQSPERYAA